jgi:hypothetical protein
MFLKTFINKCPVELLDPVAIPILKKVPYPGNSFFVTMWHVLFCLLSNSVQSCLNFLVYPESFVEGVGGRIRIHFRILPLLMPSTKIVNL